MSDIVERLRRLSFEEDILEEAAQEIERNRVVLAEVWRICHVPTPQGTKAYTHFQRDFDQVRALCKPFVVACETGGR